MNEFDKLKEKINKPFVPKQEAEINQAVLYDQKMQYSLSILINLRTYLQKVLEQRNMKVPRTAQDIESTEASCKNELLALVSHPQYRLFEVLGKIHPMLKFHVINDTKYAELVTKCGEYIPELKALVFAITPEKEICETHASENH